MAGCESASSLPSWLNAIGTFCAVFVALFGEMIRRMIRRKWAKPKLELTITSHSPHCRLLKRNNQSESDSSSDVVEICAEISNHKKYPARNCRVLIRKILVVTAGGDAVRDFVQFRVQPLPWGNQPPQNSECEMDVVQGLPCYVKIAEIIRPQNEQMENDSNFLPLQHEQALLAIALQDQNGPSPSTIIPADQKRIIILLTIIGPDISPQCETIQIDWKGSKVKEYSDSSKFQVKKCSNMDLQKNYKSHSA